MDLPASYGFRHPLHDDLGAVADVLTADALDAAGQVVLDADFLRNRWSNAGFDLATDAWVVVDQAGAIVAYGHAMRDEPDVVESLGVVHPAHKGRGLGSALFDRIEGRAAQMLAGRADARFRHAINAGDHAAAAILEARGLRPVRHFWHMEVTLERGADPGGSPEGIGIGGIEPSRDLAAIHDVLVDAFADDWGFHLPGPFEAWLEEETTSPSYDPTLWLLASEDGHPVGALTASVSSDGGWVDYLGVLPTHRGRGIAAALLRRSFAAFASRGLRRALVSVDRRTRRGRRRSTSALGCASSTDGTCGSVMPVTRHGAGRRPLSPAAETASDHPSSKLRTKWGIWPRLILPMRLATLTGENPLGTPSWRACPQGCSRSRTRASTLPLPRDGARRARGGRRPPPSSSSV